MNNSVFGKTMENIRNHKDMKLVTSREKYAKYVMNPNFKDGHPFSKELFTVEMGKKPGLRLTSQSTLGRQYWT